MPEDILIGSCHANADASGSVRMRDLLPRFDWASTSAGPITQWPDPIKHAVRLALLSVPAMAVLIGKEGIVAHNDAMRVLFGTRYDDALGKPIADVFPESAPFYRAAIDQCFKGIGSKFLDESIRVHRDGEWSTAWFHFAFTPIIDGDDQVSGVFVAVSETTSRVLALRDLELSQERFHALIESIPQIVWSADARARHDYFSSRWNEFTGLDAANVDGAMWEMLVHPEDWPRVSKTWNECVATGKPYDIEYRFLHHSGEYRWLRAMALPVRDANGAIQRWYGTSTDIEESKALEMERELVANELDHRIRNLFALVRSLVALSAREDAAFAPFARQFERRLSALHKAHEFVRTRDPALAGATSVQALARAILAPYNDNGRITIEGDDATLQDHLVTPLALVFHELATNSAKYGALACDSGSMSLRFQCGHGRIMMIWMETEIMTPGATADGGGFGSKLLSQTIERQLKGKFSRTLIPDGLSFQMEIPV